MISILNYRLGAYFIMEYHISIKNRIKLSYGEVRSAKPDFTCRSSEQ
jgi:hypothetical protein